MSIIKTLINPYILTLKRQVGSTGKGNKVQFQETSRQVFHLKVLRGMQPFTRDTLLIYTDNPVHL